MHPGQIEIRDNPEVANTLFGLINLIVQSMITHPKEVAAVYGGLPQQARDAIAKRDAKP